MEMMKIIAKSLGYFKKSEKNKSVNKQTENDQSKSSDLDVRDYKKDIFESYLLNGQCIDSFSFKDSGTHCGVYTINTNAQFNSDLYKFFEPNSTFEFELDFRDIDPYFELYQSFKIKEEQLEFINNIFEYISFIIDGGFISNLSRMTIKFQDGFLNLRYLFNYYEFSRGYNDIFDNFGLIINSISDICNNFSNVLNSRINFQIMCAESKYNDILRLKQIELGWDDICDFLLDIRDISNSSNYIKNNRQVIFEIDGIEPLEQKVRYNIPYGRSYGTTKTTNIGTSNIRLTKNFLNLMGLCSEFLYRMEFSFDGVNVDILLDKNKITFNFN